MLENAPVQGPLRGREYPLTSRPLGHSEPPADKPLSEMYCLLPTNGTGPRPVDTGRWTWFPPDDLCMPPLSCCRTVPALPCCSLLIESELQNRTPLLTRVFPGCFGNGAWAFEIGNFSVENWLIGNKLVTILLTFIAKSVIL